MNLSPERNKRFWEELPLVFDGIKNLIATRGAEGRNEFLPIQAMWPNGPRDHEQLLWMKMLRFRGNLASGNVAKAVEEMEDIIAYAGFFIADVKSSDYLNPPGYRVLKEVCALCNVRPQTDTSVWCQECNEQITVFRAKEEHPATEERCILCNQRPHNSYSNVCNECIQGFSQIEGAL